MCFYDFRKQLGIKRRCFEAKTLLDTTFSIILEYSLIPAFISHSKDTKNIFVFELPVFFSVHLRINLGKCGTLHWSVK